MENDLVNLQSLLDFNFDSEFFEDDFIVSPANSEALALIDDWPHWQGNAAVIYGPPASGKTHMAGIWQAKSKAILIAPKDIYIREMLDVVNSSDNFIIDDIEKFTDEVTFLHFFNAAKENNKGLLITAKKHPTNLTIRLPDLKSRLCAIPSAALSDPDDELLKTVLLKHFSDRQLKVNQEVIDYIAPRMQRSFIKAKEIVELLDIEALKQKKNITIHFIKSLDFLKE